MRYFYGGVGLWLFIGFVTNLCYWTTFRREVESLRTNLNDTLPPPWVVWLVMLVGWPISWIEWIARLRDRS
jgi:hypothetical protein